MGNRWSIVIIAALVVFSLYRRIRRTIGFQKLIRRRLVTRIVLLAVVSLLTLLGGAVHPIVYLGDAAGIVIGSILTYLAIRSTVIERRNSIWMYRPSPWIGAALLVLFIGRFAYRIYFVMMELQQHQLQNQPQSPGASSAGLSSYSSDPWTAATFFAFVAYYVVYYLYLLRKHKTLLAAETGAPVEPS